MTRDMEMITTPSAWPAWPVLPLTHRRRKPNFGPGSSLNDPALGFILDDDNHPPFKVYIGLMFFYEQADKMPSESYETLDALLADWQVD